MASMNKEFALREVIEVREQRLIHSNNEINPDNVQLNQALHSTSLEVDLERSMRSMECVSRDEDIRKLRFQLLLLEDENEELQDNLAHQEEHSDELTRKLDESNINYENLGVEFRNSANELRLRHRELDNMKVYFYALLSPASHG